MSDTRSRGAELEPEFWSAEEELRARVRQQEATGRLGLAALWPAFRARGRSPAGRAALVAALTLGAIAVHSLFYNALFEDPTMWALLGLIALVAASRPQEPEAA